MEDKFVWPWVGVVANVPREVGTSGKSVGKSGSALRDDLTLQGFNPTRVRPLWSHHEGHSGFALVEFTKDFQGFENALRFERWYRSDSHGKRDWENGIHMRDDKLYGWVAREADYNSSGIVGKELRRKFDLKSLSQIEEEDERKTDQLVENMSLTIEKNIVSRHELQHKLGRTCLLLESLELQNLELNSTHGQEVERMEMRVQLLYQQIMQEHQQSMLELESMREALEERARQIDLNEAEVIQSRLEREMNQKALWEQSEVDEEAVKLAEKHKKETEKLHEKIMEMKAELDERQELELEIEKLRGDTNVMKHMVASDGDAEFMDKVAKTQIELEAKETILREKMMTLAQKERLTNDEYQDARKEMIQFFHANEDFMSEEAIRVKRIGQLDPERFLPAVKRKHKVTNARAEVKAMELCSTWKEHIRDAQWHPFKVNTSDGTPKRVVDEYDEKLLKLKCNYGEEVYNEVVRAKLEIEEHNASGSYVILELWNYAENRKATMEEATDVMLEMRKNHGANKKNRKRSTYFGTT